MHNLCTPYTVFKIPQNELVVGIDMLQLHCLGCKWTENGHIFLHQSADILITLTGITIKEPQLQTIRNIEIPA